MVQIEATNRVALMIWKLLSGQLEQKPITKHQFRWRDANRVIEDEELKINQICYKLSTPDAMQHTQQAQKHSSSVKRSIETIETQRKLRFI